MAATQHAQLHLVEAVEQVSRLVALLVLRNLLLEAPQLPVENDVPRAENNEKLDNDEQTNFENVKEQVIGDYGGGNGLQQFHFGVVGPILAGIHSVVEDERRGWKAIVFIVFIGRLEEVCEGTIVAGDEVLRALLAA